LTGVQNYMAGNFVLQNSSRSGIVGQLVYMDLHGLPDEYLNSYVKNIYAVTPDDVRKMTAEILEDENMSIVIVGDIKNIRNQVEPYGPVADPDTPDE
jgi:zinc protease